MGDSPGIHQPITEIVPDGNLILDIRHTTADAVEHHVLLRVNTAALVLRSRYFHTLLETGRFGEGNQIAETLAAVLRQHGSFLDVPVHELPTLVIDDIGRISPVKSIQPLLVDLFKILDDKEIQTAPPAANLANLAIVADRFDTLAAVASYVRRRKFIRTIEAKTTSKQETALSEEKIRQRILVGMLFGHGPWIEKYTTRLIVSGYPYREPDPDAALWWLLPARLEEEIAIRRSYILRTIQGLQSHFLTAYSSRNRQCRLGYDSSSECDSFQFGEMVRFFLKIDTLQLQGTILPNDDLPPDYEGDIMQLIERLKQVPEYQVDRNHSHCGIRTRIVPLLDIIVAAALNAGVCGECWSANRRSHAWTEAKCPPTWDRERDGHPGAVAHHEARHNVVRTFFMAREKKWT